MFCRWPGDAIHVASMSPADMPPEPLRMFSATVENEVPASTPPRSWCVSDWCCAIQLAHACATPPSWALPQSGAKPAAPRSRFIASRTALPPPSHTGGGAGGGGTTSTGVGAAVGGAGAGVGGGVGAVVAGVVVGAAVVVVVVVVEVVDVVLVGDVVDDEPSRRSAVVPVADGPPP